MVWIKRNAKMLLGIVLALVVGLGAGYLIRPGTDLSNQAEPTPLTEPVGQIGKPSILPETPVTMRYHFLLCGHERETSLTGGDLIGYTFDDITKKYPDAKIAQFDPGGKGVVIEREIEAFCPSHIRLYVDGSNNLCIATTSEDDYEQEVVRVLAYDIADLPKEVIAELEEGMVFDSLEEINEHLEAWET